MTHLRMILPVLLMAAVLPLSSADQGETIRDAVKRGATGRFRTSPSGRVPTVVDVLRDTEVIVRAVVGKPRSYLAADERDIYTDYPLLNVSILYYRARPFTSAQPGQRESLSVTQLGGSVVVDGVLFTQTEDALAPLAPGSEGVFLLRKVDDRYHIAQTFYGVFAIGSGKFEPLAKAAQFAPEYRGTATDAAVAKLIAEMRALTVGAAKE